MINEHESTTVDVAGNTTSYQFHHQRKEITNYQFAVAAVNVAGQGPFSEFSDYVRPYYGTVIVGVTFLDSLIYLLRGRQSTEQIEVYNVDSYNFQKYINVPGLHSMSDIIGCARNRCLYVSGGKDNCVRVVGLRLLRDSGTIQWPVNDYAGTLSLTGAHSVLVTCEKVGKIKEFSAEGKLLRQVQLGSDMVSPWHTIQLSNGQFIVSHGHYTAPAHRVCLAGLDGNTVKSFGGPPGPGGKRMDVPFHLAVDGNGSVFVAEVRNRRVLLLSPELTYVRDVVTSDQLKWLPIRLSLDVDRRLLYIADCQFSFTKDKFVAGRVVVVSVPLA